MTSQEIWNLQVKEGNLRTNIQEIEKMSEFGLGSLIRNFDMEYRKKLNNKKYQLWYLHLGKVEMEFNSSKTLVNLVLLPIQALFLDYFAVYNIELRESSIINEFKSITTYNETFLINVLKSLEYSRIIIKTNSKYKINFEYEGANTIDLISIFYNLSEYEIKIEKEKIKLVHDRIDSSF